MISQTIQNELRQQYNPDGSELRELQLTLLNILVEFDAFIRKNGLSYSISHGTLLGAVRHGGFIPWDDDVDTTMTRVEWEHFKRCIPENGYITDRIRIREIVHPQVAIEDVGIVDILILDYAPKNVFLDKLKGYLCMLLCVLIKCKNRIYNSDFKRFKPWFFLIPLAICLPMKTLQRWKDKVSQWFAPEEIQPDDNMRYYSSLPKALRYFVRYNTVNGKRIDFEFEGRTVKAFEHYDAFLRDWYGDYMQLPERPNNLGRETNEELCDIR